MDRVLQSGVAGRNLCTQARGSLRQVKSQIAFHTSSLCGDKGRSGFSNSSTLLCKEPQLMSCHVRSLGFSKQDNGNQFLQLRARNTIENFSVDAYQDSKNAPCKDSIERECSVNPFSSLLNEDALKHMKKLMISIGAVILLSALTVISIPPAFAISGIIGTNAAAKGVGSTAVAVGEKAASSLLRSELLSSAWAGLLAGCLHTLTGPDHLAALAPLSIGRTKMESAAVGALWGCGHDAGQVIFGILFLLLKDKLHIEFFRSWGARVVGITLLVIGVMGIKEASEIAEPCVALEGGHHQVDLLESSSNLKIGKKNLGFATFVTGIVHGLQPDALLMVLPALALPSRLAGASFLGMFLLGTIMAMGSYTTFIGSCSDALQKRIPRITERLSWGSSLIAIALGGAVLLSEFMGITFF